MKGAVVGCGVILILLVGTLVGVGLFRSKAWRFERSIPIHAPPERVHQSLADLARWPVRTGLPGWSGWIRDANPSGEYAFAGEAGAGMSMSWTTERGHACTLTLTRADPASGVDYELAIADFPTTAFGSFTYTLAENGPTHVTWTTWGERSDWLGGFFASLMEPLLAKTYEDDLGELRALVESQR